MKRLFSVDRPQPKGIVLTPMIDLVTIVLLFLLKSYSTDPPFKVQELNFQLPISYSKEGAQKPSTITVTKNAIYLDDVRIVGTSWYTEHEDLLIKELYTALQGRGLKSTALAVHSDCEYLLVRKLLFTLREANINEISFTTQSRESL